MVHSISRPFEPKIPIIFLGIPLYPYDPQAHTVVQRFSSSSQVSQSFWIGVEPWGSRVGLGRKCFGGQNLASQ